MKKIQIGLMVFAAVIVSISFSAPAFAEQVGLSLGAEQSIGVRQDTVRASATSSVKVKATTTGNQNDNDDSDSATSNDENKNDDQESGNSESHRSVVASFVQNLLKVADRESGIGAEVRVIAKEQNDSSTTTVEAMSKIEKRSSLKTLLLGSDYKNLGVIRSELAKTSNQIERLKALIAKVTNVSDRVALEAEVKVLEESQLKTEAFVEAHENTFSFFGWFVKLFNK